MNRGRNISFKFSRGGTSIMDKTSAGIIAGTVAVLLLCWLCYVVTGSLPPFPPGI
jgi:hypothetical protein